MKEKRKHCQPAKLILTAVLAIALVLSPSLLTPGLEINSAGVAYADGILLEAEVELRAVKVDELNDKLVLEAYLDKTPECGLSGIDFKLSWPKTFKLTKVEDKGLLGEGDKGTSFSSKELTDNPYYIAFGNMDESAGGVSKQTGAIAYFTFEPSNASSLTAGSYSFSLQDVHAVTLQNVNGSIKTQSVTISSTQSYTYEATAGNGTVSGSDGKITVSKDTSGTPQVKTSTIESAITGVTDSGSITLDASESSSLALSKTGATAIATANKSMTVKTSAAEMTFDTKAAASIGSKDGGEKLVINTSKEDSQIATGATEADAVKFTVTAKLVDSEETSADEAKEVTSFGGGTVTISLDLPEALKSVADLICWCYTDTNYTVVNGSVKEGKYVFETNHFSDYIVGTQDTLNSFKGERTEGVTVSGQVTSYNPGNATTVQLKQNDAVKYATTIASGTGSGQVTQQFSFANVSAGTYDLVVTKAAHLTYTIKEVVVGSDKLDLTENSNTAVSDITLLVGDVNSDGSVNEDDVTVIRYSANINKLVANANNKLADVNGDGSVNEDDVTVVRYAKNMNKSVLNCTYKYN